LKLAISNDDEWVTHRLNWLFDADFVLIDVWTPR
jgi:hypothetical protein